MARTLGGLCVAALAMTLGMGAIGCGGDDTESTPKCLTDEGGTTPSAHFKADVLPIFQRSCGLSPSCHGTNPGTKSTSPIDNKPQHQPFLGPALPATATDAEIAQIIKEVVGIAATRDPSMSIVTAGDPKHSFLMHKMDGLCGSELKCGDGCGQSMPQASDLLSVGDRDKVRGWIAAGAKND